MTKLIIPEASKRGSVLIIVLWVLGLLSMFVMAFAFDMQIEARIVSTWRKKLKAEYACHCGAPTCRGTMLAPKRGWRPPQPEDFLPPGAPESV